MNADAGPTAFLDSNILIYAFSVDPRSVRANQLLFAGCSIGVQGLNEFAHVARRKMRFSWSELSQALQTIRFACSHIVSLDLEIHQAGMVLATRYQLSVYDGLMLAAARKAGCRVFWSEDLQDGLVVDGALTVRDPFRTSVALPNDAVPD